MYVQVIQVVICCQVARPKFCVQLFRTVCIIYSHPHCNNNIQRGIHILFFDFYTDKAIFSSPFLLPPLDPNISLGDFFIKQIALLQIYKFLIMSYFIWNYILHGLCALSLVKHYNSTFPVQNHSPACSVLIFIITFKMKRGTKFIKGIIPKGILDSLLNLMKAKKLTFFAQQVGVVYVKNLQLLHLLFHSSFYNFY